jgi:hypothetical protein
MFDGYTLLVGDVSDAINATLFEKLSFNCRVTRLSGGGVSLHPSTSAEVIDRLNKEINLALNDPKIKARFC